MLWMESEPIKWHRDLPTPISTLPIRKMLYQSGICGLCFETIAWWWTMNWITSSSKNVGYVLWNHHCLTLNVNQWLRNFKLKYIQLAAELSIFNIQFWVVTFYLTKHAWSAPSIWTEVITFHAWYSITCWFLSIFFCPLAMRKLYWKDFLAYHWLVVE